MHSLRERHSSRYRLGSQLHASGHLSLGQLAQNRHVHVDKYERHQTSEPPTHLQHPRIALRIAVTADSSDYML